MRSLHLKLSTWRSNSGDDELTKKQASLQRTSIPLIKIKTIYDLNEKEAQQKQQRR